MRRILRVWLPILLLGVCLTLVYFRQWIVKAQSIAAVRENQKTDIHLLTRASESIREIASLQLALRVKLFGPQAADADYIPADAPSALPATIVRVMNRHSVKLIFYRQKGSTADVQFEGSFNNLLRFLDASSPDFPRIEGFEMARADRNQVRLTLTLPAADA
ncbi:hypothetical protein HY522_02305 [bacterium]|nr:hypothetical protein [bacterium]